MGSALRLSSARRAQIIRSLTALKRRLDDIADQHLDDAVITKTEAR
jgi:hypothetical protein